MNQNLINALNELAEINTPGCKWLLEQLVQRITHDGNLEIMFGLRTGNPNEHTPLEKWRLKQRNQHLLAAMRLVAALHGEYSPGKVSRLLEPEIKRFEIAFPRIMSGDRKIQDDIESCLFLAKQPRPSKKLPSSQTLENLFTKKNLMTPRGHGGDSPS